LKVGDVISFQDETGDVHELEILHYKVLEDGKFKAVPSKTKTYTDSDFVNLLKRKEEVDKALTDFNSGARKDIDKWNDFNDIKSDIDEIVRREEQFDISGKVDTSNPIYKFYEKDVQKFINKNYDVEKFTDDNGVSWFKLKVKPEYAKEPVQAFGAILKNPLFIGAGVTAAGAIVANEFLND
jgi:hypothetical protein